MILYIISKVLEIKPDGTLYRQLLSLFDQLEAQNYQNQSLWLEFKGYQIREAGAIILAKILKLNSCLTSLNLWDNQIGATALAKALESNSSLTSLNGADCNKTRQSEHFIMWHKWEADDDVAVKLTSVTGKVIMVLIHNLWTC